MTRYIKVLTSLVSKWFMQLMIINEENKFSVERYTTNNHYVHPET